MDKGTILEFDTREFVCCGGWFIKTDNDTLRFYDLPLKSNLNLLAEILPLQVRLNWKKDPNVCSGDEILIMEIEKN